MLIVGLLLTGFGVGTPFLVKWYFYRTTLNRVDALRTTLLQLDVTEELSPARDHLLVTTDYLNESMPRWDESWRAWFFRSARNIVKDVGKDVAKLQGGVDPFIDKRGTFLNAYKSKLDGGTESYFIDLPHAYTNNVEWPLVLQLHGHVGLGIPFQQPIPEHREDCITVAPHGKGSIDYKWVAEQEILQVIDLVSAKYNIDPSRIYLQGHSMGGTGAWSLAAHYPDRFAAIAVSAGNSDHKVWEKLWELPEIPDGSKLRKVREFLEDADSAISYTENFLNTPVYCVHGALDEINSVDHSRNMVKRLQELGCTVKYDEVPLATHAMELLTSTKTQIDWLLKHRKEDRPSRVRLKVSRLKHAENAWIRIVRFQNPRPGFAEIEAVESDGAISLRTENVAEFELELSPWSGKTVRIEVGGQVGELTGIDGWLRIAVRPPTWNNPDERWSLMTGDLPPFKSVQSAGSIEDVFTEAFTVSYGTTGTDPLEASILKQEAEALASQWFMRFGYTCRLVKDTEVSERDIQMTNLICYGRPDQHAVVSRMAEKLPFAFDGRSIHVGDEIYDSEDVGIKFRAPNPLESNRQVVVFASTGWKGMFQMNNRFGNWFDWGAYENRNYFDLAVFDSRTWSPETFVVFGYNGTWNHSYVGTDTFRDSVTPRQYPSRRNPEADRVDLSDVIPVSIRQLQGAVSFNRSYEGNALTTGGKRFEKGFGVRAPSTIEFELDGSYKTFTAYVGVDIEGKKVNAHHLKHNNIQFEVFADDMAVPLTTSGALSTGHPAHKLECRIGGVKKLKLVATQASGYRWFLLSAAWGDPTITK